MALVVSVWGINVSCLSQGRFLSYPRPAHELIKRDSLSGITRVNNQYSNTLDPLGLQCLTHLQIRSGWDSEKRACVVLNIRSNKLTMVVILITDIILLSTMLVGLLRMHRRCGDTFALGRLLWTQVRCWRLFPAVVILIRYIFPVRKGVIWFLIGTTAELTPVVSPASFILRFLCTHDSLALQVFVSLYLSGTFLSPIIYEDCLY